MFHPKLIAMKKTLIAVAIIFYSLPDCIAQNGKIGSGFGTNNWLTTDGFSSSAGTSRIYTSTANGTGNQYFRLVTNWSGNYNQWGPSSSSSDYQITPGTSVPASEINENYTSKAYYINVSSTSHNYVFKTREGGNPPPSKGLIVFCVQGTIASISGISSSLSTVYLNQSPTITASLSTAFSTGQGAYLRYTTNGWTTSTVVAMTGSGTTYTASIPSQPAGTTVIYYAFTSGNNLSISGTDADLYTINLINNSGSNYSYTVQNAISTTGSGAANWSSTSTWAGGTKPTTGQTVVIDRPVTLDENVTLGGLTINSGATFIASDGTARTLTISDGGTLTNNGTFTAGSGTVNFAGAGTIAGTSTSTLNNVTISNGVNFGSSTISGTLQLNNGAYINTNPPTYAIGSTLKYNTSTTYSRSLEWNSTSGAGYPYHVQISNNGALDLGNGGTSTARSIAGNLIIDVGCGLYMDYLSNDMSQPLTVNGNLTNNGILSLSEISGGGLKIGGNLTNNGTFTPYGRTTEFIGSSAQSISGTLNSTGSTNNFYYLILGNTGGDVTLQSPIYVSNTLNLNSGQLILGSNDLTLGNSATLVGTPAETNRIKTNGTGSLKMNIAVGGTKSFPVGNSSYNSISIKNNTNTADDFWVNVLDDVYANGSNGTPVTKARVQRTWNIGKGTGNSNTGTGIELTFNWNTGETNSSMGTPRVFYYNSGTTSWVAQTSGTTTIGSNTLTYTGYMGTFSPFSVMDNATPLPVTFTSLTGNIRNGQAQLNWTIADEHNVDHYQVEESNNGMQFRNLTQVDASNRSAYQASDASLNAGANFYRVKAVDIDGKLTYSKIIRLENGFVDQQIRVYPNPSQGELTLGLNIAAGNYQIRVINAVGQTVHQQPLTHEGGSRSLPLALPKLNAGIYQVEVRGGMQKYVRSVRIE